MGTRIRARGTLLAACRRVPSNWGVHRLQARSVRVLRYYHMSSSPICAAGRGSGSGSRGSVHVVIFFVHAFLYLMPLPSLASSASWPIGQPVSFPCPHNSIFLFPAWPLHRTLASD